MINYYQCVSNSRKVKGSVTIEEFLNLIKTGKEYKEVILKARRLYCKDDAAYNKIKVNELPCFNLNFTFSNTRNNESIEKPTGFIYLDLDKETDIDLSNPLIFASWLSLSSTGRGILVKVDDLTADNFHNTYYEVSNILDIESDTGACKATQVNVLSYDPNIYFNNNSIVYRAEKSKVTKFPHTEDNLFVNRIGTVMGENESKLRFDNLDEIIYGIDFNGEPLFDFGEKIKYCSAFIPHGGITEGKRNLTLYQYAYQVRALNPQVKKQQLKGLLERVNTQYCEPPLRLVEVNSILSNVMSLKKLMPMQNDERRFFYNPDYTLTVTEKRAETLRHLNRLKVESSKETINTAIVNWNFDNGKITQKELIRETGMNKKTIEKYYKEFKSLIREVNSSLI